MTSQPRSNERLQRIGGAFAQLREDRGYTQADLARKSRTAQATISRIESGRYDCKLSILLRLLDFLKCELSEFGVLAGMTQESTDYKPYSFLVEVEAKGVRNIRGRVTGPGLRQVSEKVISDVSN